MIIPKKPITKKPVQAPQKVGGSVANIGITSDPYKGYEEEEAQRKVGFEADVKRREGDIASAFANMRTAKLAAGDVTKTQGMEQLARQGAAIGGFGGAATKMQQQGLTDINRNVAADTATLSAQESEARQNLGQEAQASRNQAAQFAQSTKTQAQQFGKTVEFQKGSFLDQLSFNYAELDETKKNDITNRLTALKTAGLDQPEALFRAWKSGIPISAEQTKSARTWYRENPKAWGGKF